MKIRFIINETVRKRDINGNTYHMCEVYSTKTGKAVNIIGEPACNVRHYLNQACGRGICWPECVEFSNTVPARRYDEIKRAKGENYHNPEKIVSMLASLEAAD